MQMMSKTDVKIVLYTEQYRDQMLALQKRLWSPTASLIEPYLKWKYDDNPSAAEGVIFLAMVGERVVGMRGYTPSSWRTHLPGCRFIPLAGDTVVDPEFEGIGLVQRMTEAAKQYYAERGTALMLNTSASRAIHYISLRSGWKSIGQYKAKARPAMQPSWYHKVRRISERHPWLWRLLSPRFIPDAIAIDVPRCLQRGYFGDNFALSIANELDPASAAALVAAHCSDDKHAMTRDAAYFTWRFTNPYFRYHFLTCHEGGKLVGYCVLRQDLNNPSRNFYIVDWCSSTLLVFRKLLSTMLQLRGNRFEISTMALTADEESELVQHGFTDVISAPDEGVKKSMAYLPSLLAMATGVHQQSFDKLCSGGFTLFEFKGIESDSS